MLDSAKGIFFVGKTIFLVINIVSLYIFLKPGRSRFFQVIAFVTTWTTIYLFRYFLSSYNFNPLLLSYILGSLFLIPSVLVFKETLQAKIFIFFMIFSLTQFIFLIFLYIDFFLSPAIPRIYIFVGLLLELAALPLVKRYMKSPIQGIIGIIDQQHPGFTIFPIASFLLLACFAFQSTYLLTTFIILLLSTMLIFFSYYLIASSISGTRRLQEMELISMTDSLTGLYNRRYIEQKIQQEYNRYQKTGSGFAIMSADIDFFKGINDLYGHDCGDSLLKSITDDLRKSIRTYDTVARWGGEEFLLLLPSTNQEQAMKLGERIRMTVEGRRYKLDTSKEAVGVTLTLGVSVVNSGDTIDEIIKRADIALYYGKQKSRNCVISFDDIKKT